MATRLSRRLAPLALLTAVLAAVPGPYDGARAAVPGKNGRIAFVRSAGAGAPGRGLSGQPGVRPDRQPDQRPVHQRHRAVLVA